MGKNYTTKTFIQNSTWTAPAGVTSVKITGQAPSAQMSTSFQANMVFIDAYGRACTCGTNLNGNLGQNNVTPASSPVVVVGGQIYQQLIQASGIMFGITNVGTAYAWGGTGTAASMLGLGAQATGLSSPLLVLGGLTWQQIQTDGASTIGLAAGGAAYCFGIGEGLTNYGQSGNGSTNAAISSPIAVIGGLTFASISYQASAVLAMTPAGKAYGWGINVYGQLGVGDVTNRSSPVAVLGNLTFQSVQCNNLGSAYGLTTAGVPYSWGYNASGQSGQGAATGTVSSPVAVLGNLTLSSIICGNPMGGSLGSIFGLTSTGVAYGWGSNGSGGLGVGDVTNRSSPVAVLGGLFFSQILVDDAASYTIGLTTSGAAYAWGINTNGQLGTGDVTPRSSPVAVLGGLTFVQLMTSRSSVWGITASGAIYGWGANASGQLGLGDVTPRSSPVAVLGNNAVKVTPILYSQVVTVVPGTSYTITLKQINATFGNVPVGQGPLSSLTLEYMS